MKPKHILLFNSTDQTANISNNFRDGTFGLTQKAISELFGSERSVITKHLKNIFQTQELTEETVCAIFAHTAEDGKNYNTKFYRLEAILSVAYRVN
jgi:hypothetical protein